MKVTANVFLISCFGIVLAACAPSSRGECRGGTLVGTWLPNKVDGGSSLTFTSACTFTYGTAEGTFVSTTATSGTVQITISKAGSGSGGTLSEGLHSCTFSKEDARSLTWGCDKSSQESSLTYFLQLEM